MADATKKKIEQLKDAEGNLMYRCTEPCMFRNEFFARGQVVSFPKDVVVEHRCIEPMYEAEPAEAEEKAEIYDPYEAHFESEKIASARAGILEN